MNSFTDEIAMLAAALYFLLFACRIRWRGYLR